MKKWDISTLIYTSSVPGVINLAKVPSKQAYDEVYWATSGSWRVGGQKGKNKLIIFVIDDVAKQWYVVWLLLLKVWKLVPIIRISKLFYVILGLLETHKLEL